MVEIETQDYIDKEDLWLSVRPRERTIIRQLKLAGIKKCNSIVIYGLGKCGKELLSILSTDDLLDVEAICDNGIGLKEYCGIQVFSHEECVRRYQNSLFLITIQRQFVSIVAHLLESGISRENIIWYDAARKNVIQ